MLSAADSNENKVSDIRQEFLNLKHNEEYIIDKTGVKTLEIINANFIADEDTIFGQVNQNYIEREIQWYKSMSLNVNDIPGNTPTIWKQVADENGTNLGAVKDLLIDEEKHGDVIFLDNLVSPQEMNFLYNMTDLTSLLSSNEGWGLSLTEAMMCGKMIMATVTGGMQDQMRFENEKGEWIDFDEEFCSNHFGTYKKCGEFAIPIFPACMSIQGSIPTPYIFDDRCDFREAAKGLVKVFEMGKEERERRGMLGREWVTSDEAMMTAENMAKNAADCIDETIENFKPRKSYTFTKVEELPKKKLRHKLVY